EQWLQAGDFPARRAAQKSCDVPRVLDSALEPAVTGISVVANHESARVHRCEAQISRDQEGGAGRLAVQSRRFEPVATALGVADDQLDVVGEWRGRARDHGPDGPAIEDDARGPERREDRGANQRRTGSQWLERALAESHLDRRAVETSDAAPHILEEKRE